MNKLTYFVTMLLVVNICLGVYAKTRSLNLYKNGQVISSYSISDIDYIEILDRERIFTDNELMEYASSMLDNLYEAGYHYDNNSNHNRFGIPSLMIGSDSHGIDMVSVNSGYNWFALECGYYESTNINGRFNNYRWTYLYRQIERANNLLKHVDLSNQNPQHLFCRAQAYGTRAYCYLLLAQNYQFTYVGNQNKPCVPIITESTDDEIVENGGISRSSVKQVYDFILEDLDEAIRLLKLCDGLPRAYDPSYFTEFAAYALRARIYLIMNLWKKAFADAKYVIDNSNFSPLTINDAKYPKFNGFSYNWIWGIYTKMDFGVVLSGIINFPSHISTFSYGYTSVGVTRQINSSLYSSIPDTDVRKQWFLNENRESETLSDEQRAYIKEHDIPPFANIKFAPFADIVGQDVNASSIPLLRIEEMYLIAAESAGMMGDPEGIELLNDFVKLYRNPYYIYDGSIYDLQDEIWHQRRIEFWGEGLATYDLLRLKKSFDRRGGGWPEEWNFNITPIDQALIYPIPASAIELNPLLDNNPIGEMPMPENEGSYSKQLDKYSGIKIRDCSISPNNTHKFLNFQEAYSDAPQFE